MSKYAPANDAGDKPYVVSQGGWGRKRSKVVYSDSPSNAKYSAFGRQGVGEYIIGCRRATVEDVEFWNARPHGAHEPQDFPGHPVTA